VSLPASLQGLPDAVSVGVARSRVRLDVLRHCDLNYKLEIARAFLDEKFYFPHNLDFRGRAYPISRKARAISSL
jgi:DNA-directed RNA polymerase